MRVRLTDYTEDWSRMFRNEAEFLRTIFGDLIIKCEHFGSTSVEGMKAKPVIDMMCTVKKIEKVDLFNSQMDSLGYDVAGNGVLQVEDYFERAGLTELIIFIFINLITLKLNGI